MDSDNLESDYMKRRKLDVVDNKHTDNVSLVSASFRDIIKGQFNQFDKTMFVNEISRGVQCTANSMVFLAFTKMVHKFASIDINNILIIGDFIYQISSRNNAPLGNFLAVTHIVKNIYIPACGYLEHDCVITCEPIMRRQWSGKQFGNTGLKCLERCFKEFQSCIFICLSLTFAFHKTDDNSYCVFDSHGRSSTGLRNYSQPAAIMIFDNISSLYNCINQTVTDDCFYRIFKYIDQIYSGKFNFNDNFKVYTLGTKNHKQ